MALIDASIYQNAPRSILNYGLQGYQQAMQDKTQQLQQQALAAKNKNDLAGYMQTKTENDRHQAYLAALDNVVKQGADFSTPDGQKAIINHLAQQGFGQESMELAQHLPKPAPNSYKFMDTPGGFVAGNEQTGQMTVNPNIPSEKKDQKLAEDMFGSMKGHLDTIMTPSDPKKGWDPLTGEKGAAYQKALAYIPPNVLKTKVAQDWLTNAKGEQQQTVFNPAIGGYMDTKLRLGTMQDWKPVRADYEKQSKAYVQAEGIVNSARFGKDQIGDVSLLNQLAQAETGSKPTDAEYRQMETSPGPIGKIAQAYNTVKSGVLLKPETIQSIMAEFRSQQSIRQDAYDASILEKQNEAKTNGVSPALIAPGGIYQQVQKLKSKWTPEAPASAPVGKPHPADSAMLQWAKQNPNAPGASDVLKANGL